MVHSTWVTHTYYSESSKILSAKENNGSRTEWLDFIEASSWLRAETPENATVLAWTDHAAMITSGGHRAAIVDSFSPPASAAGVAYALLSPEKTACVMPGFYQHFVSKDMC